jgi:hypothetical protein
MVLASRATVPALCENDLVAGAEVYEVGDQVGLAVQFGTPEDPVDPTAVEIRVRDPEGRTVDLRYGRDISVARTAPGAYQVVIVASVPGRWRYRFVGMGPVRADHDGYFDVFDLARD